MMDVIMSLNLCKVFFVLISTTVVFLGVLINIFEPYLPTFITRTIRYGKFASKHESKLAKKLEVPKSYFRHFYLSSTLIYGPIALYEVITVLLLRSDVGIWFKKLLDISCGYERTATVSALHVFIAVILLVLQVFRRFYDTHFVSVFSTKAVINLSHYFIGMIYYPAVFLIVFSEAPKFAKNDASKIVENNIHFYDLGLFEIFAILLFLWGWYHQHVTTVILGNIRKNREGDIVTHSYQIPEGDWFKYLSSPHSMAEIVMYTALTLLLWNNSGWWYVYGWVLSNQIETILLSHWWYQSHFQNFPKERKALIPFIY